MPQQKNTTRRSKHGNGRPRSKRGSSPLVMAVNWGASLVAAVVVSLAIINTSAFQSLRTWLAGGSTVAAVSEPNSAAGGTSFNQESRKGELPSFPFETPDVPTTDDNDSELATEDKNGVVLTGHQGPLALPAKPIIQPDPSQTKLDQALSSATQTNNPATEDVSQEPDQDIDVDGELVIKPGQMSLKPFQVVAPSEIKDQADDSPDQPTAKLAVPSGEAQRDKLKEVKSLLADQYADRTAAGKIALASELLQLGKETTDDTTAVYVCLVEANETASQIGDVSISLAAADLLTEKFEVSDAELFVNTISSLVRKLENEPDAVKLLRRGRFVIQKFVDNNEFKVAMVIARKLLTVAKKLNNPRAVDRLEAKIDRLKQFDKKFKSIELMLSKLQSDPHDQNANQAVGEFYCLVKGDFDTGLPYLVKGSNPQTKKIALLELSNSGTADEELAIADRWWEISESDQNERLAGKFRAAQIYRSHLKTVSGIKRQTLLKRIEDVKKIRESGEGLSPGELLENALLTEWKITWEDIVWDQVIFFDDHKVDLYVGKKKYPNKWEIQGDEIHIPTTQEVFVLRPTFGGLLECTRIFKDSEKKTVAGTGIAITKQANER